jgi:hypothetical protein
MFKFWICPIWNLFEIRIFQFEICSILKSAHNWNFQIKICSKFEFVQFEICFKKSNLFNLIFLKKNEKERENKGRSSIEGKECSSWLCWTVLRDVMQWRTHDPSSDIRTCCGQYKLKKTKSDVNSHIGAIQIVLFTQAIRKFLLPWNYVSGHKMSWCTHKHLFWTFWNTF